MVGCGVVVECGFEGDILTYEYAEKHSSTVFWKKNHVETCVSAALYRICAQIRQQHNDCLITTRGPTTISNDVLQLIALQRQSPSAHLRHLRHLNRCLFYR